MRTAVRRNLAVLSLSVPILSLAAPFAGAEEKDEPPKGPPRPLEIGAPAPDFDLPGVDGKKHGLEDFSEAKILAVVFTCNHCPTAQAYEERIKKLARDYRGKGVALVAISPNDPKAVRLDELGYTDLGDSLEEMKLRAKAAKFDFPYLYDGDKQEVSRAFGPRATPHLFIFDEERKLRYSGRIDSTESGRDIKSHDARNALDALLAGKPVAVERTRSFGCSIKWSDKRDQNEKFLEKLAKEKVALEEIDAEGAADLRRNKSRKLRLINVWATWCGPCVIEFPELVKMNRMYRRRPFEFISVSLDPPAKSKDVLRTLEKFQASNRNYIYDSEDRDALAEALDEKWTGALPFTILVKPGGKIVYRHEGQIEPLELRREIVGRLGRTYHSTGPEAAEPGD